MKPERGLAAPKIRHAGKAFGDGNEILFHRTQRRKMTRGKMQTRRGYGEVAFALRNRKRAAERQRFHRRQFDRRPRKRQRAQHRDLVRRRSGRRGERRRRQPADIAVGVQLAPAPAFAVVFIDCYAFALERFGIERGIVRWCVSDGRLRRGDFAQRAIDKARGLDLAFKIFRREISSRGRHPWVVSGQSDAHL